MELTKWFNFVATVAGKTAACLCYSLDTCCSNYSTTLIVLWQSTLQEIPILFRPYVVNYDEVPIFNNMSKSVRILEQNEVRPQEKMSKNRMNYFL